MFDFISGQLVEKGPTYVVVENNGIGYFINITLYAYELIKESDSAKLYIEEHIREDAHALYGFYDQSERALFRHLVSVSGIGSNTARMMLSSMSVAELHTALVSGDVNLLKTIKGIGLKTAQRLIVELKDKLEKQGEMVVEKKVMPQNNSIREEALSALVMLGFAKASSQKVVDKILRSDGDLRVEHIIKQALKML